MTRLSKRAVYEARTRIKFLEMSLRRVVEESEFIEHRWGDIGGSIEPIRQHAQRGLYEITAISESLDAPMDGRFDYEEVVDREG